MNFLCPHPPVSRTLVLQNARLCVEVAPPRAHGLASRWARGGFITQVTLDGQHQFCAQESPDPSIGNGGQGLCHEFGIFRPVGFEETPIGGRFPKIGVGLLFRPDEKPYSFQRPYDVLPFDTEIERADASLTFHTLPRPCNGWAFDLSERLELHGNTLSIVYKLRNVGQKRIQTHEYRHNFLSFGGARPNPDWRLQLAPGLKFKDQTPLVPHDGQWGWPQAPLAPMGYGIAGSPLASGPLWTLRDVISGLSVSETLLGPLEHLFLWVTPDVVSPEVFVNLDVALGGCARWTRIYHFCGPS